MSDFDSPANLNTPKVERFSPGPKGVQVSGGEVYISSDEFLMFYV